MKKDALKSLSLKKVMISNLGKRKIMGGEVNPVEKTDSCRFCDPVSFVNTNCCWTWWNC